MNTVPRWIRSPLLATRRSPSTQSSTLTTSSQDQRIEASVKQLWAGEIHLWLARCSSIAEPALLARYQSLLSDAEQERRARYRFERDRHRDLIARVLVRTALSHYAGGEPADWAFAKGEHGKPALLQPPLPLQFNLSHSRDLVVCALAMEHEVGVDVEYIGRTNDVLAIAQHYFSEREVDDLFALPPEVQRERFFDYWTLKEAYIKARGEGISLGLGNFSFLLAEQQPIDIAFAPELRDRAGDWQFQLLWAQPQYRMAVASRQGERPLKIKSFEAVPLQGLQPWLAQG